ncbi:MAG: LPS assembly lipoprotein LptE [Betaproteobacteria bacterium]|nr:LPS assembly lipoprotein LptE [Betaproteobacteria bacterium]
MRIRIIFRSLPLFALLLLAACGFQLRGAVDIPYTRLYIANPYADTTLGAALRRQINAHQPEILVDTAGEATAVFRELSSYREREITVLDSDGRAREYQLRLLYSFRIETPQGQALTTVASIRLIRELTYDDNQVLSKEQEEEFLWRDMENDLVQQILRRLATLKPVLQPEQDGGDNKDMEQV